MCRQKQSIQQIGALFLLIIAAVLLSIGEGSRKGSSAGSADRILLYGIVPVLVASVLSGLASSLCQWASQVSKKIFFLWFDGKSHNLQISDVRTLLSPCMQVKKHSSYLMTVEMSLVGSLCLLASTYKSPDGEAIRKYGIFHGWTPLTLVMNLLTLCFHLSGNSDDACDFCFMWLFSCSLLFD